MTYRHLLPILILVLPLYAGAQQIQESTIVKASFSDFSNLHPLVVHIPIMLLLVALVSQVASFFVWKKQLDWVTFLALAGGVAGAFLAGGVFHPHTTNLTPAAQQVIRLHDTWADYTMWSSVVALILKGVSLFWLTGRRAIEIATTIILLFSAVAVSVTSHYGATLVYIHGVGVQGNFVSEHDDHDE